MKKYGELIKKYIFWHGAQEMYHELLVRNLIDFLSYRLIIGFFELFGQ